MRILKMVIVISLLCGCSKKSNEVIPLPTVKSGEIVLEELDNRSLVCSIFNYEHTVKVNNAYSSVIKQNVMDTIKNKNAISYGSHPLPRFVLTFTDRYGKEVTVKIWEDLGSAVEVSGAFYVIGKDHFHHISALVKQSSQYEETAQPVLEE